MHLVYNDVCYTLQCPFRLELAKEDSSSTEHQSCRVTHRHVTTDNITDTRFPGRILAALIGSAGRGMPIVYDAHTLAGVELADYPLGLPTATKRWIGSLDRSQS